MVEDNAAPLTEETSFVCPKCGSGQVRRSSPKTSGEKLLHAGGIHFYRCRACGRRGQHLGVLPGHEPPADSRKAVWRKRRAMVGWVALTVALGVGGGFFGSSCSAQAQERVAP